MPRPAAEIIGGSGADVLAGRARIVTASGEDVTAAYVAGARAALAEAEAAGAAHALLIDGSPSCGGRFIHDGGFAGRRIAGEGVTAALLRAAGIAVYSEAEIDALAAAIDA